MLLPFSPLKFPNINVPLRRWNIKQSLLVNVCLGWLTKELEQSSTCSPGSQCSSTWRSEERHFDNFSCINAIIIANIEMRQKKIILVRSWSILLRDIRWVLPARHWAKLLLCKLLLIANWSLDKDSLKNDATKLSLQCWLYYFNVTMSLLRKLLSTISW